MRIKPVWKEFLRLYKKNFPQLCLAMLVEMVLRAIALTPLLFLADKALAPLACAAVPAYLLIALPARQNYAMALQEMMNGGSVFSLQLISTRDYGKKLWRGLKGTMCILLWSALTIAGTVLLYLSFKNLMDGFTLMGVFYAIGGSVADGLWIVLGALAASTLLILLGCAVHSGARHAAALDDKGLLRGNRIRMMGLWILGGALLLPFIALVAAVLGSVVMSLPDMLRNREMLSLTPTGLQAVLLAGGVVLLLLPALPLRSMLPAVYLHMEKENRNAQA